MAFHKFLRAAIERTPIEIYGDGSQTRDFTFIADVVSVTLAAANRGRDGAIYNIGGGARWRLNDILRLIEDVVGSPLNVRRISEQPGDVRDTFADTTRAREELAFAPAVSVKEGLQREAEWLIRSLDQAPHA
jgi:UDP-glucose 4-epimerase